MKFNGWDISNADARQWNVTPGFHTVKNDSDWVRGSPQPVMFKNKVGFKTIRVTLLVKAGGRQAILSRCSEILTHFQEPGKLELDGFVHDFYGVMTKYTHNERVMNRWHILTVDFDGYECAKTESIQSFSGAQSFTVTNTGTLLTPAIIEITPQAGAAEIELTGLCRNTDTGEDLPVKVRELITGNTVALDGITGLFTQEGDLKAGDIDIWGLPTLLPGNNQITVDNAWMDITVRFHPRFM